MSPGKGTTARTTGNGFALRGLVNPTAPLHTHEGGKKHVPKSESLSKKSPSYTEYSTEVKNTPSTSTTTKTNSTSGSLSTSNYDDAIKAEGTKILPKGQKSTPEMTAKYNAARKAAKDKDKANAESNSASSSSKTIVTKPSRTKKDFTDKINSYRISASDQQKKLENKNKTLASKNAMNKVIAGNKAAKDSANVADEYRKTQVGYKGQKAMTNEAVTTEAVLRGNAKGRKSAKDSGYFTKEEGKEMFNPNYGQSTVTAGAKGYKAKGSKNLTLKPGGSQPASSKYNSKIVPGSKEDVGGQIMKGSKKGTKTFSKKDANTGSRGSRGE